MRALIDSLFPPDLPEPEHWERRYPPRGLPAGAEVNPGLAPVAIALGPDEVLRRIYALGGQRETGTMAP